MNASKILELIEENKIDEIKSLAELEITQQAIKEKFGNTELKRFKAAQRYLKKADKNFAGTWEEDGKQCFSDGYTGFILNKKIDGLPTVENDFNLHNTIKLSTSRDLEQIEVNVNDVKAKLKIYKATHKRCKVPCKYELGISLYNAEFILNCYEILGGDIVFKQSKSNEISPAILESENGTAVLLPIKKNKKECA